jgi:cyclase
MKLKKRIIFTLLFSKGYFYLSRNFRLQKIGNLEWLKCNYNFNNVSFYIDELIILNVDRDNGDIYEFCKVIKDISREIFVPLSVGGGINNLDKVRNLFASGADKVVLNTSLFAGNSLPKEICSLYGKQCLVASLDLKKENGKYSIYTKFGSQNQGELDLFLERKNIIDNVGEFYLNSINNDGTGNGLDMELAEYFYSKITTPFIIAGGIGKSEHILNSLSKNYINAVSTAHLLNFIGEALKNCRDEAYIKNINLAKWIHIKDLKTKYSDYL